MGSLGVHVFTTKTQTSDHLILSLAHFLTLNENNSLFLTKYFLHIQSEINNSLSFLLFYFVELFYCFIFTINRKILKHKFIF